MLIALTVGIMLMIAALQAPLLIKQKQWPELIGFGVVWLTATAYSTAIAGGAPLPSLPELTGSLLETGYRLIGIDITLNF